MALIPIIQPPIMLLLTSREERLIRMPDMREVSRKEIIIFPVVGMILCTFPRPGRDSAARAVFLRQHPQGKRRGRPFGNTARNAIIDTATILVGLTVGASTQGDVFLNPKSVGIFALGAVAFSIATASGILFAKFMNLFLKEKINPLLGAAGVSAVPGSAREVHMMGQKTDPNQFPADACCGLQLLGGYWLGGLRRYPLEFSYRITRIRRGSRACSL